jgi:hypothetical protein
MLYEGLNSYFFRVSSSGKTYSISSHFATFQEVISYGKSTHFIVRFCFEASSVLDISSFFGSILFAQTAISSSFKNE